MKIEHVKHALWLPGLKPGERLLLATLTDAASPALGVFIARDKLATLTGIHPKTIQEHLRHLLALGYIDEIGHAKPGRVRSFMPHPERWPPAPTLEGTPVTGDDPPPTGHDPPPRRGAPPSEWAATSAEQDRPPAPPQDLCEERTDAATIDAALAVSLKAV